MMMMMMMKMKIEGGRQRRVIRDRLSGNFSLAKSLTQNEEGSGSSPFDREASSKLRSEHHVPWTVLLGTISRGQNCLECIHDGTMEGSSFSENTG